MKTIFWDLVCSVNSRSVFLFLLTSVCLSACSLWQGDSGAGSGKTGKSKKIAQVGASILYADDLQGVIHPGMLAKDSARLAREYIDAWVKREVVLEEARNQKKIDKDEIKQKVKKFKDNLLRYVLEERHVNNNLDTLVKDSEVKAYYEANKGNFVLKQHIIKGILIKIPLASTGRDSSSSLKVGKLLMSTNANRKKTLRDFCVKSAEFYHIEDSTWVGFDDLINNTPFNGVNDKAALLKQSKFQYSRKQDKKYVYYLKVRDFKLVNQETPYEFAKPHIVELILQKRKVELIQKMEEDILKKARKSKKIKIY
ncbi:hypothetical protein [Microscilla marina]|uniref:hypothetical protein n=1 Tax=Microscilla marina TaxID=1027 RepID=UPI0002DC5371|nr:hypothetical protein [Microscilla marina]